MPVMARRAVTRQRNGPAREPHPDPRIEARLQRILSLRKIIAGKEALVERDRAQITSLRATIAKHPSWDGLRQRKTQVTELLREIIEVEADILKLHDDIEERLGEISDMDLTAL